MRRLVTASVLVLFLSEVRVEHRADAAPVPFPNPLKTQHAGSYFRGTRFHHVTIHLKANGNYTAQRYVCVGAPRFTEGKWRVSGSVVVLQPSAQGPAIPEIPQRLHLVHHNGTFVLVANLEDEDFRKRGVTPLTAFHKQPARKVD